MAEGAVFADYFARPRGAGRPTGCGFHHGRAGRVEGGTVIELWLRCADDRIVEARFEAFGCPAAIACASWLCEFLPGRTAVQARELNGLEIARRLALPAEKTGVALVVEDALAAALGDQQ